MWQVAELGEVEYWVSETDPVCVLREARHPDVILSWLELEVPPSATYLHLWPVGNGLWISYGPTPPGARQIASAAVHVGRDGAVVTFRQPEEVQVLGAGASGLIVAPATVELNAYNHAEHVHYLRVGQSEAIDDQSVHPTGMPVPADDFVRREEIGPTG